ncbi:MAG: ROK family transcriptional regulator [Actinobacteria bacterium]|nr:ROK family transcriptional regulator [Actinomycetota bacterium]
MNVAMKRSSLGATPGDAKQHNRALIMRTLYADGPASRADIARSTGLTKVTVSGIVAELIDQGLMHELGPQESQRPGKPAILVDIARDAHAVLCLDLSNHERFRGAVLDLDGNVLARRDAERAGATGDAAVALAIELALDLLPLSTLPLLGIGVGTPGVVDDHGVVRTAPNLGWTSMPLQQLLSERTGVATIVANDANVSALAEYRFGETSDDFILITIGHGVGSGLILDGHPVTGSNFASGEIGQVMVGTDLGIDAPYSREQVLEHWLSVPALQRALGEAGDSAAVREQVLSEAGRRLGIALAPVVGVLNLAGVVLSGPAELIDGTLANATLDMLTRRTMPDSHDELDLHTSTQGEDIVLRGALATVLKHKLGVT